MSLLVLGLVYQSLKPHALVLVHATIGGALLP